MRRLALILAAAAALAGAGALAQSAAPDVESISYETGPCLGRCPVYRVTVSAAGTGWFEGRHFTAAEGGRRFRITRAQYDAMAALLAPHRPRGSERIGHGHPRCRMAATDHPSASVTWVNGRAVDRLAFDFGCRDPGNAALVRALTDAPGLLPIGDYIGPR